MHEWGRDELLERATKHVEFPLAGDQGGFPNQLTRLYVIASHVELNASASPHALHQHMGSHHEGRAADGEALCIGARISIPTALWKVVPKAFAGF